jgi:predicted nucleic acid-binding protein
VRYLADATVLSEPTRNEPDPRVVAWLRSHERDLVVDPFIMGEVRFGVLLLPPGRERAKLEAWFADAWLVWNVSLGMLLAACDGRSCWRSYASRVGPCRSRAA